MYDLQSLIGMDKNTKTPFTALVMDYLSRL